MFKIFKKILKIPDAIRYALLLNKAYEAHVKKNYIKALEHLNKANDVHPLLGEALLQRAHLKLQILSYSDSIEDAKLAIIKIKKKNYTKIDKDYLIYYACRIGTLSQSKLEGIEQEFVDQEFKQVFFRDIQVSKVSSHIVRNFPLKSTGSAC